MGRAPVVLLGEVHDNAAQHALRAQALQLLLQQGARPALALEQLDRERQPEVDRILADRSASTDERVDRLAALGAKSWNWTLYRPFLRLALQYGLPVVAADLSRADAMRVSQEGYGAAFDSQAIARLGLDRVPGSLLRAQEEAVEAGHCHKMPPSMLPSIARAQIARDAALASAIAPYAGHGVVLLTGNGHVRKDIGVPHFLQALQPGPWVSIALLESGGDASSGIPADPDSGPPGAYDAIFPTPVQPREDPCATLQLGSHGNLPELVPAPGDKGSMQGGGGPASRP